MTATHPPTDEDLKAVGMVNTLRAVAAQKRPFHEPAHIFQAEAACAADIIEQQLTELRRLRAPVEDGTLAENTERSLARGIANRVLDRPNADPDDDLAVLARQLLRAHERLDAERKWRPMSSAPRDASRILVYLPKSSRVVQEVWWALEYEGGPGYWSTPHGPAGRGYTILPEAPTAWQPLPAPPKEPRS